MAVKNGVRRTDTEFPPQLLPLRWRLRQLQVVGILCQQRVRLAQSIPAGAGPGIVPRHGDQPRLQRVALDVPPTT
jgi:hypothetical protein